MAVMLRVVFPHATHAEADDLESRIGAVLNQAGGPPDGLMAHVVHPEGDGFVLIDVWRSESEGLAFVDGTVRSLAEDMGLEAGATAVSPVWTFARP